MDSSWQTPLALTMLVAFVLALIPLALIIRAGRQLRASGGPGIVAFELAESDREANRHLRAWGPAGQAAAKRSLAWDFAFIAGYVVFLGAAALYLSARADSVHYGWLTVVEVIVAALAVLAGMLDCVENNALLAQVNAGQASRGKVLLARWCAQIKFALVGVAGLGILVGFGIVWLAGQA